MNLACIYIITINVFFFFFCEWLFQTQVMFLDFFFLKGGSVQIFICVNVAKRTDTVQPS